MRIAVLTSSRADYSIYYPLLRELNEDHFFDLSVIAFGTHLSRTHGYTVTGIEIDGFKVSHRLETFPMSDSPAAIAEAMGRTTQIFSGVWEHDHYDIVVALGDRYEMFAACASCVPFNFPICHIHGGEETQGAIDNSFRHAITHMAQLHFAAAEPYAKRVSSLKGSDWNVFNTGSLSMDNLRSLKLLTIPEIHERFQIDLSIPTILITFHPETVLFERNKEYVEELIAALKEIDEYQFLITMPNADTLGNMIRSKLQDFIKTSKNAIGVESLGTLGYLSCMKNCAFMLGNTSSGFIEAAYFPKYVVNIGTRQQGRIVTENIRNCAIQKADILDAIKLFDNFRPSKKIDIYGDGFAAQKMIKILKTI